MSSDASQALSDFISTFIESVNANGLWSTLGECVPLLAISILFGLGVYQIIRVIRAIIHARGY